MGSLGRIRWSNLEDNLRNVTYHNLLTEGTMVGRDLAVTNTRTGARKSIFADVSTEVAANTADELVINNRLYAYASMNGATNVVSTVLSSWGSYGAGSSSIVANGDGSYRFTVTGPRTIYHALGSLSGLWSGFCQAKLVSGSLSSSSYFGVVPGSDGNTLDIIGADWTNLQAGQGGATADNLVFYVNTGDTAVFDVRDVRCNNNWGDVKHAALPDGSAAGASHGGDLLTCSPSFGSTGSMFVAFAAYGWNGTEANNPGADTNPRLIYDSDTPTSVLYMSANGTATSWTGDGGVTRATSNTDIPEDTFTTICVDWNGTKYGLRRDAESRVEVSETNTPVAPISLGNRISAGEDEAHGAIIMIHFDRVLSVAEQDALRSGIAADIAASFGGFR